MTRVLLVGAMGSGKTTVGRALSALTGWPYVDNDALLVERAGRSARDLLEQDGEPALRAAESDVLTALLALEPPVIAGVAAGVVESAADRARLRDGGHVVWLRVDLDALAARTAGTDRPWSVAQARALAERRAPLYAEVASQVLDPAAPEEMAREVLSRLR